MKKQLSVVLLGVSCSCVAAHAAEIFLHCVGVEHRHFGPLPGKEGGGDSDSQQEFDLAIDPDSGVATSQQRYALTVTPLEYRGSVEGTMPCGARASMSFSLSRTDGSYKTTNVMIPNDCYTQP